MPRAPRPAGLLVNTKTHHNKDLPVSWYRDLQPNPGVWKYEPIPSANGVVRSNAPDRKYEPGPSKVVRSGRGVAGGTGAQLPLRGRQCRRCVAPPAALRAIFFRGRRLLARVVLRKSGLAPMYACSFGIASRAHFPSASPRRMCSFRARVCALLLLTLSIILPFAITTLRQQQKPQTRERAVG